VRQFYGRHFLWIELGLAVVLAALASIWIEKWGAMKTVDDTLNGNRAAIYTALASIFGSLLGFVITAASIIIGFSSSDRLAVVRQSRHYPMLWRVFVSSIRALALATLVSLVALVLDRDQAVHHLVLYFVIYATLLAVLRLARCVWVLENIIALISRPEQPANPATPH
jgi:hypothetical protein